MCKFDFDEDSLGQKELEDLNALQKLLMRYVQLTELKKLRDDKANRHNQAASLMKLHNSYECAKDVSPLVDERYVEKSKTFEELFSRP